MKAVFVKNLVVMVFVCMASGCPLSERPWKGGLGIYLSPTASYKPSKANVAFKRDVQSVIQIVDRFATKHEFKDYTYLHPSLFIKDYEKSCEDGSQAITVYYDEKKDIIFIGVGATYEPSPRLNEMAVELRDELLTEFGSGRIKWETYK